MQNSDCQNLSTILPEIKSQTFGNSFENKLLIEIKPSSSKQEQKQGLKKINQSQQPSQIRFEENRGINMKNQQKQLLNSIIQQPFQKEITELKQAQISQEQRTAVKLERYFKKDIPNQTNNRNNSENSFVGMSRFHNPNTSALNNTDNLNFDINQKINMSQDEIVFYVPTQQEQLKKLIQNDQQLQLRNEEINKLRSNEKNSNIIYINKSKTINSNYKLLSQEQTQLNKKHKDFIVKKQKIKGSQGLNIKVVEMWINDTVCEAESDASIPNKNKNNESDKKVGINKQTISTHQKYTDQKDILKNFGLDRKALVNKGISKENIDRIYRSLFVYSFGFYEMIQDIFSHVSDYSKIVANVWKIYGILLEYCSRTDFINTITQLEKEKTAIFDNLEEQIATKQQQFDALEIIEKEKRQILESQIFSLKQEKANILNEKYQLEEDFKQADSAFNEEVGLRLQFEHKINELHSIHRELLMKHNRLIDEYDSLKIENEIMKTDQNNNNKLINSLKVLEAKTRDSYRELQRKANESTIQFEKLKERAMQAESDLQHKNRGADKYEGLLNEEQRINEDLRFQINNQKEKIGLQIKNEDIYKRRIEDFQGEQKYQNTKMDDQSERFEKLQQQIYDLEKEILNQKSNAKLQQDNYGYLKAQSEEYENQILQIKGQKKKIEQEQEYCINRNELLVTDLEALQKLIRDMKIGRIELEEEYIKCKLRLNNLQDTIKAKNNLCKDLEIKMEEYEQNHLKLTVEFQTFQHMAIKEQDSLKQKISKLEREQKSKVHELEIEKKQNEFSQQKINLCNEQIECLRKDIIQITSQQRDDKFTLNNQSSNINQLTNVIESEKSRNSDLLKQLSSLTIINSNLQRETKSQKVIIRELQDNHSSTIEQIQSQHKKDLDRYINVEYKVHSMVYEDLYSKYIQDFSTNELQKEISQKNQEFTDIKNEYDQTYQTLKITQKMLSTLKKYATHFLKSALISDKKNTNLTAIINENELKYQSDKDNLKKLYEQQEMKLYIQIQQQQQEMAEMQELVNQKLQQIQQLQQSFQLIEQIKNEQSNSQKDYEIKKLSYDKLIENDYNSCQNSLANLEISINQSCDKIPQNIIQNKNKNFDSSNINNNHKIVNKNLITIEENDEINYQNNLKKQNYNFRDLVADQNHSILNQQQQILENKQLQLGNQQRIELQQEETKLQQNQVQTKYIKEEKERVQIQQVTTKNINKNQKNDIFQSNETNQNNIEISKIKWNQFQLRQNINLTEYQIEQKSVSCAHQNNSLCQFQGEQLISQEKLLQQENLINSSNKEQMSTSGERIISENILDSSLGQFVPYHLSTLARINQKTYHKKKSQEEPIINYQKIVTQQFYSGGTYRLSSEHSKKIQKLASSQQKSQIMTKDNKEFGKLFQIVSDHYNNNQNQNL